MPQKTVVIGAGPVGALAAIYAAKRGHEVEVYELRSDLRDPSTTPLNFTKSINLAVSHRGISAIEGADPGLAHGIIRKTLPMYGRMIHGKLNGSFTEASQAYDVNGRAIYAADRGSLNKDLLDYLENMPNVRIFFDYKLTGADFRRRKAWVELRKTDGGPSPHPVRRAAEIEISFDLMIGADGAYSAVRFHMMKFSRMFYQQEYIETLWCEFHMSPGVSKNKKSGKDSFKISPNHLHIWPAGNFMFIAIPDHDKSFTCTLFMPQQYFNEIDADPGSLVSFFDRYFPGVAGDLIPEDDLRRQYKENAHLPLISIKCSPHHFGSSAVIIGDAAHAMVPFYGQGMNAGLEDVQTLFKILDKHVDSQKETTTAARAQALQEYTDFRCPDAHAINDLAMGNYNEMASAVRSPLYLWRKKIEEQLSVWMPSLEWATQYSRVSFSSYRYSEVVKSAERQGRVLTVWMSILGGSTVVTAAALMGVWILGRKKIS
ncbi:hypothetical protein FH972_021161 [Carpinus fangiana]|uniref:Kynurenine 3-monooxygenase n=1 Tax=Carpinus fangiana TaxID=176857 RepID=A0A5N6KNX5_9ROSI|nr:hypothetical protein FH972_021161 [Carpinus fangiana]